jgi:hypothetical protein
MNSRIILVAVLVLGMVMLVSMWPVLTRRFLGRSEDRTAGRNASKELRSENPKVILEAVEAQIAEQQAIVDQHTTAGPDGPLEQARLELRELKKYRERLIHEARERGF